MRAERQTWKVRPAGRSLCTRQFKGRPGPSDHDDDDNSDDDGDGDDDSDSDDDGDGDDALVRHEDGRAFAGQTHPPDPGSPG